MNVATEFEPTLVGALWPVRRKSRPALRSIVLMLLGSLAVAISAQVQVPLEPVPITMQTFAVLVVGVAYGRRLGAATLALYLAEGAIGLPVFAGFKAGLPVLFGATGGYLFGFVLAAAAVGWLAERGWDRNAVTAGAAMAVGNLVIYAAGIAWLGAMIGYGTALDVGLLPFLMGDALKIALGACLLPLAWKLIRRLRD
ncbi:MAG: biotin transporter BioY [Dongiaceae bacterium]